MLEAYPKLRDLRAGGNVVSFGDDELLFVENPLLEKLSLRNCGIRAVPQHELVYLKHLNTLELDRNCLSNLTLDLRNLSELAVLNLSRNAISSLPATVTDSLSHMVTGRDVILDLTGNPISCSCNNLHFTKWLKTTNITIADRNTLTCNHPTLGLVSIMRVDLENLQKICFPSYASVIAGSIFGTLSVVCLIAVAVTIRRKRWAIRYYVHAARQSWHRRFGNGYEQLNENYLYDAFVVYSADDRFWVHDKLMQCLENEHGMHLCIHYRDFIPGHDIEDTIIEALKNSRKAIIVLSPNFLQSNWCHFEFKMARQIDIEEDRSMVILVILESITGCKLSNTLATMLQRKTYLNWPSEEEGQGLFWTQIVCAVRGRECK